MANVDIKLGYKDSAWFTANASLVLKLGQIVYLEQTGTYKLGDGVTQLSALTFLGGGDTVDVNTIGAAINVATSATPNDTDLVMSVESSVAKKNTWTQIKSFLKTYYDTIYTTTSEVATQITTALNGYVKKGTLTTNYIPKATASDTIGDSTIENQSNGRTTFNSTYDGVGVGQSNFDFNTSVGGLRKTHNSITGTLEEYFTNGVKGAEISETSGYYNLKIKTFFAIYTLNDNIARFFMDSSTGKFGFGSGGFTPNERVEIRDGNLRINDLTASQIVETDSNKNLVSAAKGTAYNKDFGTGTTNVVEIGSTLGNTKPLITSSAGKLQTSDWVNIVSSCTFVGWSSYTTKEVDVIDMGAYYMLHINVSGTSNSATTTIQLPYTTLSTNNGAGLFANNGTTIIGRWIFPNGSNTITFGISAISAVWTASGTKSVGIDIFFKK